MASLFYAPGAVEHYVRIRGSSSAEYLGTAVTAPEVETRPAYLNVINDIGGRTLPMQKVGDREQHVITTTLNRFDYDVYNRLKITGNGSGGLGFHDNTTQGVLTLNYLDFELILVFAAVLANPAAFPAYPVGRRYWSGQIVGSKESTVGTRVQEIALVIECNELFNPANRVFDLYTEITSSVTSGLPSPT